MISMLFKNVITIFASILKLLQILASLPVTTTSSELSILWYMAYESKLNDLPIMNIQSDVIIDSEDDLNKLATKIRKIWLL